MAAAATSLLVLAACSVPSPGPLPTRSPSPSTTPSLSAELRLPDASVTVLADADPVTRAVAASAALFIGAPVAVVAPVGDLTAQLRGAGLAVAVGGPLLLVAVDPAPVVAELDRLGVAAVLTVGPVGRLDLGDVPVLAVPADDVDAARLLAAAGTGTAPTPGPAVTAGGEVAAVAVLDPRAPVLPSAAPTPEPAPVDPGADPGADPAPTTATPSTAPNPGSAPPSVDRPGGTSAPTSSAQAAVLPRTDPAAAVGGGLVLATGDPAELAPVATARAAGQPVVVVPGGDPRASAATVAAVAAAQRDGPTSHLLAVGPGLGTPDRVAWTVATAATGVQLPGGGQLALTGKRMVALYGTPVFAGLGLLGEQDLPAAIVRAQAQAAEYQALTTDVVVPAFEIIATVASAGPGDDGNYSNELAADTLLPWVQAAGDAGMSVILDLQPGRTDFLTQAKAYEQLLRYPHVGLALDPEWRLAPDQVHLRQIGSVGIDEVNAVVTWLADLTRDNALPQKVLVLHQFMLRMIQERERLDTSREELTIVVHVDGQGSQPAKAGTWAALQVGAPAGVRWGWKNFVDEDVPMLTPTQTYQVVPLPDLVTYQ